MVENEEIKKPKLTPFSDLTDHQLMSLFGEASPFRFELYGAFLNYVDYLGPTKVFGTLQVAPAGFSPDPLLQHNRFSHIFNRQFNNPAPILSVAYNPLPDFRYSSLPVSSSTPVLQIAAQLYIATDKVHDLEILPQDYGREPIPTKQMDHEEQLEFDAFIKMALADELYESQLLRSSKSGGAASTLQPTQQKEKKQQDVRYIYNEAFQVCDTLEFINIPDKPNGSSGKSIIKGKDGSLELYYAAFKYAVDAYLEIEFEPTTSEQTKVTGNLTASYGSGFHYDEPAYDYHVKLFEDNSSAFKPGKLNLRQSVLPVPAKSSLIIDTELYDNTSDFETVWEFCEFSVPREGTRSVAKITGKNFCLKVTVNWKLPYSPAPSSSDSSVTRLVKERNRWCLQEEIAKVFNTSLERTFNPREAVSCSISTCSKEDGGDYLCSSVMHVWPEIKKTNKYKGPKHAGVVLKDNIMGSDYKDMMERCVVCGPGFVKFKLRGKWIAESICKMLTDGIDTWAPKLSVKKSVVYFLSRTEEMHMGNLRSIFIGKTLARMLEFSGVVVLRKRIHDGGHLDIEGKRSYSLYINEILDLLRRKGLTIVSEGDEAVFIEGRKLPLVYLTALRHALDVEKADWILHVTDVGQRDYIEMCITAAKHVGLITDDHSKYPLSHVGFGNVQGDDFERFEISNTKVVSLANLLDEAKIRCKVLLAGQAGMVDEWNAEELEHAAEALGCDAVKYADLKNKRLTNYTFSFDQMLNEEGNTAVYLHYTHHQVCSIIRSSSKDIKELMAEELTLTNDDERELGLHLLRFTEVLGEACTILAPHILCEYLYELCKKFNGLQNRSSVWQVVGSSTEKMSKLSLCKATEVVVRKCFDLLGITPICKI